MKNKSIFMIIITLALATGYGCQSNSGTQTDKVGLKNFENCDTLKNYVGSRMGSVSATTGAVPNPSSVGGTEAQNDSAAGAPAASPTAAPTAPSTTSNTVEEADLFKQDGNRLYVVNSYSGLVTYDLTDPSSPKQIGQFKDLKITPQTMYAADNKVVLIGGPVYSNSSTGWQPQSKVLVLDLTDASAPITLREYAFTGSYQDSRKVGASVYLVLQRWMNNPVQVELDNDASQKTSCGNVYIPQDLDNGSYTSFVAWDVVGIDTNLLPATPQKLSVVGSYDSKIYATPGHLYMTNYFYEKGKTGIYLFDLDATQASITPKSSAQVSGSVLNQFSMDETDGVFRIASTKQGFEMWIQSTDPASSESASMPAMAVRQPSTATNWVTTFKADDDSLNVLGETNAITPGESITAARFLGNNAYLTTYVQTDPLVVVDVSDPTAPKVRGQLLVPGQSNYLQAWGEDRLLSIGSSGSWNSATGFLSVSLFDISDLDHPKLIQKYDIPNAYSSEAQYQHLAFSFFEDRQILAIPLESTQGSEIDLFHVDRDQGFTALGKIDHKSLITDSTSYTPEMRRSFEEANFIYTISDAGLKVDAFDNLTTDSFGVLFPDFVEPTYYGGCGCSGDVCSPCAYLPM